MSRWIYARKNANTKKSYDIVMKIEGDAARVVTENKDFPSHYLNIKSEAEEIDEINRFMIGVIDWDYTDEWDECRTDEVLKDVKIMWEQEV